MIVCDATSALCECNTGLGGQEGSRRRNGKAGTEVRNGGGETEAGAETANWDKVVEPGEISSCQ